DWPGNVRELVHVIERAAVMCNGDVIDVGDLPALLHSQTAPVSDPYEEMPLRDALAALEKRLILRALDKTSGNRAEAARLLGIARPQLYTKMEEHGIAGKKE